MSSSRSSSRWEGSDTRVTVGLLALTLLWPSFARAQPAAPASAQSEEAVEWSFASSVYFFQVVDDRNYAQPTVTADRGWLHLEARYNYEDYETGSLWFGYNLGGGETIEWELTPIVGGVFGRTDAFAPGFKGSVSWRLLSFYSEGEFVITSEADDRFFYSWSELAVTPLPWWRVGAVAQRTRVYATERDLQRGLFTGFTYKSLDSAIYVFNPDDTHPFVAMSVTIAF